MNYYYKLFILFILLALPTFSYADFQKNNPEFIKLLKGKAITVVAPASGTSNELMTDLRNITALKLLLPDHCFNGSKSLFHSSANDVRFECLKNALSDESSKIIWCLRGGYGSAKLIPSLKQLKQPNKDKWLIGFSDITALHIFLSQEWGWKTIHGNGIVEILNPAKSRTNFTKIAAIISGQVNQSTIEGLSAINSKAMEVKQLKGRLTGGNLTTVETSIGTIWQIKTVDKILFLEDVGIKPYQLDRALNHLLQAGLLVDIKAIIFGACGDDDQAMMAALKAFATTIDIPVFKTNRFGHNQINDPIIYNTDSKIIFTNSGNFNLVMQVQ